MSDLVTLGETMALLSAPRVGRLRDMKSLRLSAAGSESNVAIGVSRLGYSASWTGRVGADELGQMILTSLRAEGVDVSTSIVDPSAQTALMFKERRGPNVARVTYYRRGYAGSRLSVDDLDETLISAARMLHVTGITLGLSNTARVAAYRAVEIARSAAVPVSFDFNYRAALWAPTEAAEQFRSMSALADLVFAGEDELAIVEPDDLLEGARRLAGDGERAVVVKRGPKGALAVTDGAVHEEAARNVVAVDPVGAGDAFVAGYMVGTFDGLDVPGRLAMASATGAYAVTVLGDWEGMPSREDLASDVPRRRDHDPLNVEALTLGASPTEQREHRKGTGWKSRETNGYQRAHGRDRAGSPRSIGRRARMGRAAPKALLRRHRWPPGPHVLSGDRRTPHVRGRPASRRRSPA